MGWALSGTATRARARSQIHTYAHARRRDARASTYAPTGFCIIVEALLLPVCVPPHFGSLAMGGPNVWAGDELLMAATWHCHVAFSMTVASVSVFLRLLYTPGESVMNKAQKDCHLV